MKTLVMLSVLWSLLWAAAEPRAIGTVTSGGSFRLNGDTVIANGTLTDGAVLETARAGSLVRLTGGARLALAADSRATLYSDRLVLEKGEARLENGKSLHLEALGLAIRPGTADSSGRIGLLGAARVRVETLSGSFGVSNSRGVLVANVAAGSALAFEPQQNPVAARLTGVLIRQDGHFLLRDEVTQVTVELVGPGLEQYAGMRIEVTGVLDAGATPVSGASQVIRVTQTRRLGGGAAKGGARGGAGGAGKLSATTIALIGGVGVAATLGGLAANDLLPGQGGVSR